MDTHPPGLSFIGIVDFSEKAKWLFLTESVSDLLGYEPRELVGRPSLELVHPDEYTRTKQLHFDTISQDKAAVLVYLRMKHKNPHQGYVLCGIVTPLRTVVHNVLVGSVSFASPGAKALHNASTAQEITVISPSASHFQIKRWNDPLPLSPQQPNRNLRSSPSPTTSSWSPSPRSPGSPNSRSDSEDRSPVLPQLRRQDSISFDHLPNQSLRTLFILDRFTSSGTILYCSNDLLVTTLSAVTRSFFDFVAKRHEETVRSWIDCVKGWGVNELGQPSDGGFGFGRFTLLAQGRDSSPPATDRSFRLRSIRVPEPNPTRQRGIRNRASRTHSRSTQFSGHRPHTTLPPIEGTSSEIDVDAIFSAHSDGLMVVLRRSQDPEP
ncbi:hypothetical protein BDZ94DRAFT_1214751 [Collybia nuda]|uniref:PAS domain-containing protein n=1 Tax=Collybia nuda TaxID=64659 RepID=A0A9P5YCD1_9AGAR|nr:hypothetical protein BDZ94DRAFT_1214751 [Collybia nuda]